MIINVRHGTNSEPSAGHGVGSVCALLQNGKSALQLRKPIIPSALHLELFHTATDCVLLLKGFFQRSYGKEEE